MPTCTVQTHTNRSSCDLSVVSPSGHAQQGFTLTEMIVVLVMVSLFVLMAVSNLYSLLGKNTFRIQAHEFVSAMQMAAAAAAESDKKYEVIIDITEQSYLLRQITSPDLAEVLEEEIIIENDFTGNCRVAYVEFDDGDFTNESRAKFRAGRSGWQYGGKIVLLDSNDKPYSVLVNRINRMVVLHEGNVGLLTPKGEDETVF